MWARIENETVVEVTESDPAGRYHESLKWVECSIDVSEGWTLQDMNFRPPPPSQFYTWSEHEWVLDVDAETAALKQKMLIDVSRLMAVATHSMAPLKDAIELQIATDGERALYDQWRLYRVELNRVELQKGFPRQIAWPVAPGAEPVT